MSVTASSHLLAHRFRPSTWPWSHKQCFCSYWMYMFIKDSIFSLIILLRRNIGRDKNMIQVEFWRWTPCCLCKQLTSRITAAKHPSRNPPTRPTHTHTHTVSVISGDGNGGNGGTSEERSGAGVFPLYLCHWSRPLGWSRRWAAEANGSERCELSSAATTSPRCGRGWWCWCWAASLRTASVYSCTTGM